MGKLVTFEKRKSSLRTGSAAPQEGKILMFTGVRYQRTPPVLPSDGTPARPKRKRG